MKSYNIKGAKNKHTIERRILPIGNLDGPVYKVFLAAHMAIPESFNTSGYYNMLNMAFFKMTSWQALVFVIMPSDWKIYQHRFLTESVAIFAAAAGKAITGNGASTLKGKYFP